MKIINLILAILKEIGLKGAFHSWIELDDVTIWVVKRGDHYFQDTMTLFGPEVAKNGRPASFYDHNPGAKIVKIKLVEVEE